MSNLSDKPWLVPGHMYQYDIGWLVDKLLSFETELNTAIDLKTIHYADPIQWDITTQYSPNTVVVDPKTGTAYMSKVPVPAGVLLTNTDYWVVIFNYQRVYDKIMSGVAFNDKDNLNASKDLLVNDLVWYGGDLYRCTRAIPQGTTYLPGTNLTSTTIADCLATYYGRDRVAQVLNDTVNVSGNYTLNAGDIAETASNVTIHSTQDMVLDADGNRTVQVAGSETSEVGGKLTQRVTGSRKIDVDGDDSVHVDGVTSTNRGGAVTEVYGSSVDKRVTGAFTESFEDTATSTYNGKRIVHGADVSTTYTRGIDVTVGNKTLPIQFPDKTVDLYNLQYCANVKDFGAVGDGVTDDTMAIQAAINQTQYDTILVPPGKYHTTKSLSCRDGIRVVGMGRNTCEFIDSFDTGTFTLANNVFFESLNFETDNKNGYAFYGKDVFAVNINHVDNLGGFFKHSTSKFIKMVGSFNTLLLNDCIIDCGSRDGFAIDLTADGNNALNKDCQFRNIFVDTWYADTGGSIKSDSVYGLVLNNSIIRSHATCLLLDRTIATYNGDSTCDAEYCYFDGDSTDSAVIVNGKTEFHDMCCSYGLPVDIHLNGIMYYWQGAARLQKILYGVNAFALINADTAFTNPRANGSWDFVKPAKTAAALNISLLSQGLPTFTNWGVSLCAALTAPAQDLTKAGICLNDASGKLILFGRHGNNLAAKLYDNATTYNRDLFSVPWVFGKDIWVAINKTATNWIYYISADGVSWVNAYQEPLEAPTIAPIGIGIGIDNEHGADSAGYAMIANITQWHIENLT